MTAELPEQPDDHRLRRRRFPEVDAGGYTRIDGKVAFFLRVQTLLQLVDGPCTVVDFGAGRGVGAQTTTSIHRQLQDLRGAGRTVIGLDIDSIVLDNPLVDIAHVIPASGVLPLEDSSVDLIVSEFVWEHIDEPESVVAEFERVLKPGGWVCACTPNRFGYIAIGASLVPNRLHVAALRRLQPQKAAQDTFPTRYRMNTRRSLARLFPDDRFLVAAYTQDAEPDLYSGERRWIEVTINLFRYLPPPLRSLWFVFVQKR